jgi:hypothetical protein
MKQNLKIRLGWGILLTLSILLTINGVHLYFFIVDTPGEQTTAILLTGFGMLAVIVTLEGFKRQSRWAWIGTWVVIFLLLAVGLHMLRYSQNIIAVFYLSLTAIAIIGQLLSRPPRGTTS